MCILKSDGGNTIFILIVSVDYTLKYSDRPKSWGEIAKQMNNGKES